MFAACSIIYIIVMIDLIFGMAHRHHFIMGHVVAYPDDRSWIKWVDFMIVIALLACYVTLIAEGLSKTFNGLPKLITLALFILEAILAVTVMVMFDYSVNHSLRVSREIHK